MQIQKIMNINTTNYSAITKRNNQQNFKGVLIPHGLQEASWSNAGGMGESYYERYTYLPTGLETSIDKDVNRLGKIAAKKLPDNSPGCSYSVLVDIPLENGGIEQRYFDKPVAKKR